MADTPKAVLEQEQDSEKALEQFQKDLDAKAAEGAPLQAAEEAPPAEPAEKAEKPNEVEELKKQLEYERHRNDSLQGRLDSQLRPLNATVKELREKIASMEQQAVNSKKEALGPAHLRHLKPEEIENLDKSSLDVQARVAQGVVEGQTDDLVKRIDTSKAAIEERLAKLEQDREAKVVESFWDRVEKLAPGIKEMNVSDANWFKFLDQYDASSGRTLRELGEAAIAVGDVRRIASLVDDYRAQTGTPKPDRQVKPETVKAAASAAGPGASKPKPMLKESDIKRFYEEWTKGKYRGREKEAEAIERMIDTAASENRIVPG